MNRKTSAAIAAAVLVAALVGLAVAHVNDTTRRRREPFLPLIPLLGLGLTAAGVGARITGVDTKIQNALWNKGGGGGGTTAATKFMPTYRGRQWDGFDWVCPTGTVETGAKEDAKACITSEWHNPVWRKDGKGTWGWNCPNGTVPNDDPQWEKKCVVGWTLRQQDGGVWKCPSGTTDSKKTWSNSSWLEAHKQCKRAGPYTLRINANPKVKPEVWKCPAGSFNYEKNTWGSGKDLEFKQCKWDAS